VNAALVASAEIGVLRACDAMGVARATFYRRRSCRENQAQTTALERQPQARALTLAERNKALELLTSERFCDSSPSQVISSI
jgi:putative transposase